MIPYADGQATALMAFARPAAQPGAGRPVPMSTTEKMAASREGRPGQERVRPWSCHPSVMRWVSVGACAIASAHVSWLN